MSGPLRDLDDRLLPRAAARVRSWADLLDRLVSAVATAAAGFDVRSLDERWSRGPVRVVQRHPLVVMVVAAVLLATGVGVAVDRERSEPARPGPVNVTESGPSYDAPQGSTLGPAVGADVTTYVRTSTEGLVKALRSTPGSTRVALVSLSSYLTPDGAELLLDGLTTARVYLRAPAAGRNATPFPIEVHGDLGTALTKAYDDTARSRAAAAHAYQGFVDTLKGSTKEDQTFRRLYETFARASAVEAREYGARCGCVYAAVVVATPAQLLTLRARPGVRAVQVAGPGVAVTQVQVSPLPPEVTGTVPRPTFGGLS